MACRGVLFAINEEIKEKLLSVGRTEIVEHIVEEIEEVFFENNRDGLAEVDKAWDAIQRAFSNGKLLFTKEGEYPLNHLIFGESVLYGDRDDEDDYIVTLNNPQMVKDIYRALEMLDESSFKQKYQAIDESEYGLPMGDDDFQYTWDWLKDTLLFWKMASEQNLYVIFTVDQ